MSRMICERCGETYHDENMGECVNCLADTCPYRATSVSLPGREADEWWRDRCLKEQRDKEEGK